MTCYEATKHLESGGRVRIVARRQWNDDDHDDSVIVEGVPPRIVEGDAVGSLGIAAALSAWPLEAMRRVTYEAA